MAARLYNWIYSLWYPALLGAAIVLVFTTEPTPAVAWGWPWFLIAYLTLQYGEGVRYQRTDGPPDYDVGDLVLDVIEILAMAAAFTALGYRLVGVDGAPPLNPALSVMLVVPILHRLYNLVRGRDIGPPAYAITLTILSGLAIGAVWSPFALTGLWILFGIYLVVWASVRRRP
jgi:hypothetical protein